MAPALSTSRSPATPRFLLAAMLIAGVLGKNMLVAGLSYGDLILMFAILLGWMRAFHSLVLSTDFLLLLVLLCCALVGALASELSNSLFVASEFWQSFAKLAFLVTASAVLAGNVRHMSKADATSIVAGALLLNAVFGIYVYVAVAFDLGVPYEFLWFGQEAELTSLFFEDEIVRMRGAFSEPSLLGAYQVLGLAYVYLIERSRLSLYVLVPIILSIVLSFSLSTYALFVALLAAHGAHGLRERRTFLSMLALLLLCIAIGLLVSEEFQRTIIERIFAVATGADISALGRLIATWELPFHVIRDFPLFGAGLGNLDIVFHFVAPSLQFGYLLEEMPQGWNVAAYVLGSLGLSGSIVFLALFWHWTRVVGAGAIVFLAYLFTTGAWLEPTYWIFFTLYYHRTNSPCPIGDNA